MEDTCAIYAGWAIGPNEWCEPPNVGAPLFFGLTGRITIKIEAHYDNALGTAQQDQSGMRLSLTPTRRTHESAFTILGMDYFDRQFVIPPGEPEYTLTNICPSAATTRLRHAIWAYAWNPHMHLYGKKLVTEHYRCGQKIGELGRIEDYEFDNQQSYLFDKPIKILPGDALYTTCTYDTTGLTEPVVGGEETTDEMCQNFLTFFPTVGTVYNPSLFTMCASYNEGLNPDLFGGYDRRYPFTIVDTSGSTIVYRYRQDPEQNRALCCYTNSCERNFLSAAGKPCVENEDCQSGLTCQDLVCVN